MLCASQLWTLRASFRATHVVARLRRMALDFVESSEFRWLRRMTHDARAEGEFYQLRRRERALGARALGGGLTWRGVCGAMITCCCNASVAPCIVAETGSAKSRLSMPGPRASAPGTVERRPLRARERSRYSQTVVRFCC